jgi:hypothetical protein
VHERVSLPHVEQRFLRIGWSRELRFGAAGDRPTRRGDAASRQWLEAQGFTPAELSDKQKAALQSAFDRREALVATAPSAEDVVAEIRTAAAGGGVWEGGRSDDALPWPTRSRRCNRDSAQRNAVPLGTRVRSVNSAEKPNV